MPPSGSPRAKTGAIAALALIAFVGPLLERMLTGRVEPFGNFDLGETVLSVIPIYLWYYVDKAQRQFRAGPLLNAGVVALAIIALPVYFVRSRGWQRGAVSTALAAAVFAGLLVLGWLGETIGAVVAP